MYELNAADGTLPFCNIAPYIRTSVCFGNELDGFDGCATAARPEPQANWLLFTGLTSPPVHRLHPVQRISAVQCVAFRLDMSALTVAWLYIPGTVRAVAHREDTTAEFPFIQAIVIGLLTIPPPQAKPTHVREIGATICRIVSNGADCTLSGMAMRKMGLVPPGHVASAKHTVADSGLQYLVMVCASTVVLKRTTSAERTPRGDDEARMMTLEEFRDHDAMKLE